MKLSDYKGYTLIGSNALGEQRGLSPKNSLYSDIKKVITDEGSVFVSESNKTIILSKGAEENYARDQEPNLMPNIFFKKNIIDQTEKLFCKNLAERVLRLAK